ncbi:MAG TPA: iron dependent repressor, metal binding and dimerization domain protein, partial [Micromonosporaceae bacterium]
AGTVARMERAGLVRIEDDRHLELTRKGRSIAVRVMRKHRLAECLLVHVIGMDPGEAHEEACRWEHVISETVERRLVEILGHPTHSPYGNPIPGLDELGDGPTVPAEALIQPLHQVIGAEVEVLVHRIDEPLQADHDLMRDLWRARIRPGEIVACRPDSGRVLVGRSGETIELAAELAAHIHVEVMAER